MSHPYSIVAYVKLDRTLELCEKRFFYHAHIAQVGVEPWPCSDPKFGTPNWYSAH
jgi:hypothetical protein